MTGDSANARHSEQAYEEQAQEEQAQEEQATEQAQPALRPAARGARRTAQLAMICLGLISGAAGSAVIPRAQGVLPTPESMQGMPPYPPEAVAEMNRVDVANAAIAFGLAGALVAGTLGGGLGLLVKSRWASLSGTLTGLILGLLLGGIGGGINTLVGRWLSDTDLDSIFKAMLIHAPEWICLSIAVGLTVGLCSEASFFRSLGATLAAAIVAALVYPLLSILLFPAAYPDLPVPFEPGTRMLWFASGSALLGWGAARSAFQHT